MRRGKKILIIITAIIIAIIIGIMILGSDGNTIVYKRESRGAKDLKMTGYFEKNKLLSYDITYYIEYNNEETAKLAFERMNESNVNANEEGSTVTTYELKGEKVFVKTTATINKMDASAVDEAFGGKDGVVNKKQFKAYAEKQGYKK